MRGGGEFIINGSERVIVSQLHRSPGVDFLVDSSADRHLHSCWIIPERGSWIELNVTKKEILQVRIDQSGKFSAVTFLRALEEDLGTDQALMREFFPTKVIKKTKSTTENAFAKKVTDRIAVGDIVVLKTGEVLVPSGMPIPETAALEIAASELAEVEIIDANISDLDMLILNSMHDDSTVRSHEDALLKIYSRLRPGNPPQLEKARELFHEKFYDPQRYRLGRVGRFRLNRKFSQGIDEKVQVLQPQDILNSVKYLVGKVAPKSKSELTPEEKLLHAIFGKAGVDVKNASLTMPPGTRGVVIDARKFSRRVNLTDEERAQTLNVIRDAEMSFLTALRENTAIMLAKVQESLAVTIQDDMTGTGFSLDDTSTYDELRRVKVLCQQAAEAADEGTGREDSLRAIHDSTVKIEAREAEKNKIVNRLSRGDELPTGVLEMVKIYVATKRNISVGDKMAGRHGNKGVISKICPIEDMPYLDDGQPVDIVLNPLGVPSRMNVGQILETHLGFAAHKLGIRCYTPAFDGAKEEEIAQVLEDAEFPSDAKFQLFDGRSGVAFEQKVTVGIMYMLKLHHLVDEKVHARATGPYSLITQQPLGGKARFGGQRFGEMEVWALEAYGAASILQELLTVKSDDVDGRTKIYESMVKGLNVLEPGTPVSFEVLTNEIRGLGLNMQLHKKSAATL